MSANAAALRSAMLSKQRLTKEYRQILSEPIEKCLIRVDTADLFTWYYCIDGVEGTEMEGGKYFGRILFPQEYPLKPPTVHLDTPNGAIIQAESICMSMTAWHPESWSPSWGPRTIVLGLFVFLEDVMKDRESSATLLYPRGDVKGLANVSKQNNMKNPQFIKVFGDLVTEWSGGKKEEPVTTQVESAPEPAAAE